MTIAWDFKGIMMRSIAISVLLVAYLSVGIAQTNTPYYALVQTGKSQLQAGNAGQALVSGETAIKLNPQRWEAHALVGGALMNLKRYEEAADQFSEAIKFSPQAKQGPLRDLRRQCVLAESASPDTTRSATAAPVKEQSSSVTTQAEVVLWKSIEGSRSQSDFQEYLSQYPNGAFTGLARTHLNQLESEEKAFKEQGQAEQTRQAAKLGISVTPVTPAEAHKLGVLGGVTVTDVTPGSFGDHVGLPKGDLIIEINRQPVVDESTFRSIVAKIHLGDDVVFVVRDPASKSGNLFIGGTLR
jgi:tetratricopeptide (TPR) repeat protein